jgi:hypothetical protein
VSGEHKRTRLVAMRAWRASFSEGIMALAWDGLK